MITIFSHLLLCILSVVPTVPGRCYMGHFKVIPNKDVGIVQKAVQVNQRPRFKFAPRPFTTCLALPPLQKKELSEAKMTQKTIQYITECIEDTIWK